LAGDGTLPLIFICSVSLALPSALTIIAKSSRHQPFRAEYLDARDSLRDIRDHADHYGRNWDAWWQRAMACLPTTVSSNSCVPSLATAPLVARLLR
jgi:hypothetical protein